MLVVVDVESIFLVEGSLELLLDLEGGGEGPNILPFVIVTLAPLAALRFTFPPDIAAAFRHLAANSGGKGRGGIDIDGIEGDDAELDGFFFFLFPPDLAEDSLG